MDRIKVKYKAEPQKKERPNHAKDLKIFLAYNTKSQTFSFPSSIMAAARLTKTVSKYQGMYGHFHRGTPGPYYAGDYQIMGFKDKAGLKRSITALSQKVEVLTVAYKALSIQNHS